MPEETNQEVTAKLEALQLNLGNNPDPAESGGRTPPDLDGIPTGGNTPVGNQGNQPAANSDDTFVNEFLKNVAPEDLPAVEKYYKEWGKQVTQGFQAKSAELQKYLDLGVDYDSIVAAINIARIGDTDPLALYNSIGEFLREEGLLDVPGEDDGDELEAMFEGASPELVKKFKQLEANSSKFESFLEQYETQEKNKQGQAQLDKMMADLHNRHGKFDEDAVLAKIMRGMKPDEAVTEYNKFITENYNPKPKAPPVVGGGRTAVDQVDSSKMNDKKTRLSTVASILGGIDT